MSVLALPVMAQAQDVFHPPTGCQGVLTVQNRGCMMTHVWQCEGDAEGLQWLGLFNAGGLTRLRQVDREFQWLETYYMNPPATQIMHVPAPDPESITELMANGADVFEFTVEIQETGRQMIIRGFDRLTGETSEINGHVLHHTEYQFTVYSPDGIVLSESAGRQFVSDEHRIFIFGENWDLETPDDISDRSPVDILTPGEPGFFAARPRYDCELNMSKRQVSP